MSVDIQSLLQNNLALILMALWVLPWKGWALWRAARLGDKWWFVAILVLNTLAILDIIYIFAISKRKSLQSGAAEETPPVILEMTPSAAEKPRKEKPRRRSKISRKTRV